MGTAGLERIGEWKKRVAPLPLASIGGVNIERLQGVFAVADSAAVVTDITLNTDSEAQTCAWIEFTEPWR